MKTAGADVVVIGASFAGLLAAAAAARVGARVILVERDQLTDDAAERPGVPQGAHPHVLLHRGLVAMQNLLPRLGDDLAAVGAVPLETGDLAWLTPDGWLPTDFRIFEFLSVSRPLLEVVVRRRVLALPQVEIVSGTRVRALRRDGDRWAVVCLDDGTVAPAGETIRNCAVVVDASGRSSRLPHWLVDLGVEVAEPRVVEAKLGYATRRYRQVGDRPVDTAVFIAASPDTGIGAVALPVEDGEWLFCAAGYGSQRPSRDPVAFDEFLRRLRDPVLADFAAMLEPIGDVRIHRQTANRRHHYDRVRDWPAGLLVVGDALSAFNPLYGQGITVAACQAEVLTARLRTWPLDARATTRLQEKLVRVADAPWALATGEDVRYPSCDQDQNSAQRLLSRWTHRVTRLAVAGNPRCRTTLGAIYNLMAPPTTILRPRIAGPVLRSLVTGIPSSGVRPAALAAIPARSSPVSPPPAP